MKYDCNLIFLVVSIICLGACQSNDLRTSKISGYQYIVYADEDGRVPNINDYVYFHMDIYDDQGKLLQSYRNQKQMPALQIADPTDPIRKKNPLVDVLASLSLQDSVGIIVPRDSVPGLAVEYDYLENLEYRICVQDILNEESFRQKLQRDQEEDAKKALAMRDRLPAIKELADQILSEYNRSDLDYEISPKGVKYVVHERGAGATPEKDLMVTVQYYGSLVETSEVFDNSFEKGRGYTFRIGREEAIAGWDEAIPLFPVGTKASIFVPSELGYGEQGYDVIPGNAELYFYVEVEDVYF